METMECPICKVKSAMKSLFWARKHHDKWVCDICGSWWWDDAMGKESQYG